MGDFGLPALFAVLVWWFTTGIILFLDGLPNHTFRWSMTATTAVLVAAVYCVRQSSADVSVAGAYAAFSCAIVIWGWLEMSFLMGFITGPRKVSCPDRCNGWRHFLHASQAIIYNEIATVVAAAGILFGTLNSPNRLALWTFIVLWIMRLSAKLNLFLGVPNVGDRLLPAHLQYLKGFFRRRPMNYLFPLSITGATVQVVILVHRYASAGDSARSTSLALLISLLSLAILEHWFMVLPLPTEKLWGWALRSDRDDHPSDLKAQRRIVL